MKLEKAFGNVLRKSRKSKLLSQEELAHLAQVDRTYISMLERGLRNPTIVTVFSVANALDTTPDKLILETEKEYKRNMT